MSLDVKQFRQIIRETLVLGGWYSGDLEELLFAIAAHESLLGKYPMQIRGPARGVFGMEPATMRWLWEGFLVRRPHLRLSILTISEVSGPSEWQLTVNLAYQIGMARANLARFIEPIPPADDIMALARYWKRYWNTYAGKGTIPAFIKHYQRFAG